MAGNLVGTTVVLIRHGERNPTPPGSNDPHLSAAGLSRAGLLVQVLGHAKISAIFTSEFIRTKEMAKPLATNLGLTPVIATDMQTLKSDILSSHPGETVLVVGHSQTVPQLIELLGGGTTAEIAANEFDNLFIATLIGADRSRVTKLKYGQPT